MVWGVSPAGDKASIVITTCAQTGYGTHAHTHANIITHPAHIHNGKPNKNTCPEKALFVRRN